MVSNSSPFPSRVNVLLLEIDLDAFLLQLPYRHQTVHGVPGESADGFGHDQVHRTGQSVRDHFIESVALAGVEPANALIRVDLHELPIRVAHDEPRVIVHLRFV